MAERAGGGDQVASIARKTPWSESHLKKPLSERMLSDRRGGVEDGLLGN